MADRPRIQNCYQLCRSTLRNASFYKGGASLSANSRVKSQFAIAASNNFLDMAFLDWSKVFADLKGEHHWSKILPADTDFMDRLLAKIGVTADEFDAFVKTVKHYRDKVIAHADVYTVIDIPVLDFVIDSTVYLYERLRSDCGYEPAPCAPYDIRATLEGERDVARTNFGALSMVPD